MRLFHFYAMITLFYFRSLSSVWTVRPQDAHRRMSVHSVAAIDLLLQHPLAQWGESTAINAHNSDARKKLRPVHAINFPTSCVFDEFARTVCSTGVISKKEFFETWAAAVLIDGCSQFGQIRRIADVASGHGLLSWSLLLLDDERSNATSSTHRNPRTAVCIDQRLPPSAEILQNAMTSKWPHLTPRFHFVEGDLRNIDIDNTCLLASVHACGSLSDELVRLAIESSAPLAVVPCCHSVKRFSKFTPWAFNNPGYNKVVSLMNDPTQIDSKSIDIAEALDYARQRSLLLAGYDVHIQLLPKRFTAKNKMITATPGLKVARTTANKYQAATVNNIPRPRMKSYHSFMIPCADNQNDRETITFLSGKLKANRRKLDEILSKLYFDTSMWLPTVEEGEDKDDTGIATAKRIEQLVSCINPFIIAKCELLDEWTDDGGRESGAGAITRPTRTSRTFRVWCRPVQNKTISGSEDGCSVDLNNLNLNDYQLIQFEVLLRNRVKDIHREIYNRIPAAFPGFECRLSNSIESLTHV